MNDKGHFLISLVKSAIRIAGCIWLGYVCKELLLFAILFGGAEVLGIVEELADKR